MFYISFDNFRDQSFIHAFLILSIFGEIKQKLSGHFLTSDSPSPGKVTNTSFDPVSDMYQHENMGLEIHFYWPRGCCTKSLWSILLWLGSVPY